MNSSPLKTALSYSRLGWEVLPIHTIQPNGQCSCTKPNCGQPGKHPRIAGGFNRSSSDPGQIKLWQSRWI
ncbi:bifunctional DNA primase/polymerase, partial [Planctomycetota bacterium]